MELSRTIETETGEMIVKRVSVPLGLEELMEGLAKEVILKKPKDIYVFASEYFARLLQLRDSGLYRGNVRSAKLAVKQPSKAMLVGHNMFTSSESNNCSRKNIERKPSTPYYLNHSSRSATRVDEVRRERIREHLRAKKEEFIESESNIKRPNTKDSKLPRSISKNTQNKREELAKTVNETPVKAEFRRESIKTSTERNPRKNKGHSISHDIDYDNGKKIYLRKKSKSQSSVEQYTKETPRIDKKINSLAGSGQNVERINKNSESTEKVEKCKIGSENLSIITRTISSTQDENGQYEISYNPDLLASDREVRNESEPSRNLMKLKEVPNGETNGSPVERGDEFEEKDTQDLVLPSNYEGGKHDNDEKSDSNFKLQKTVYDLKSVILIQSLWRGLQSRKKANEILSKDIPALSKLSKNAENEDEEQNGYPIISDEENFPNQRSEINLLKVPDESQKSDPDPERLKNINVKEIEAAKCDDCHNIENGSTLTHADDSTNQQKQIESDETNLKLTEKPTIDDKTNGIYNADTDIPTLQNQSSESGNVKHESEYEFLLNEHTEQKETRENRVPSKSVTEEMNLKHCSSSLESTPETYKDRKNSDKEGNNDVDADEEFAILPQEPPTVVDEKSEKQEAVFESAAPADSINECISSSIQTTTDERKTSDANNEEEADNDITQKCDNNFSTAKQSYDNTHLHGSITNNHDMSLKTVEGDMNDLESTHKNEMTNSDVHDNDSKAEEKCKFTQAFLNLPQDNSRDISNGDERELEANSDVEGNNDYFPSINLNFEGKSVFPQKINGHNQMENIDYIEFKEPESVGVQSENSSKSSNEVSEENEKNDNNGEVVPENTPSSSVTQDLSSQNDLSNVIKGKTKEIGQLSIDSSLKNVEQVKENTNKEFTDSKNLIYTEVDPVNDEIHKNESINSGNKSESNNNISENVSTISGNEKVKVDSVNAIVHNSVESTVGSEETISQKQSNEQKGINGTISATKDDKNSSSDIINIENVGKPKIIRKRSLSHKQMKADNEEVKKNNKTNLRRVQSQESNTVVAHKKEKRKSISLERKIPQKESNKHMINTISPRKMSESFQIHKKVEENKIIPRSIAKQSAVIIPNALSGNRHISDVTREENIAEIAPVLNEETVGDNNTQPTVDIPTDVSNEIVSESKGKYIKSSLGCQEDFRESNSTVQSSECEKAGSTQESEIYCTEKPSESNNELQVISNISEHEEEDQFVTKTEPKEGGESPRNEQAECDESIDTKEVEEKALGEIKEAVHDSIHSQLNNCTENSVHIKDSDILILSKNKISLREIDAENEEENVQMLSGEYAKEDNADIQKLDNTVGAHSSRKQDDNVADSELSGLMTKPSIMTETNNIKNIDEMKLDPMSEEQESVKSFNYDQNDKITEEPYNEKVVSEKENGPALNEADGKETNAEAADRHQENNESDDIKTSFGTGESDIEMKNPNSLPFSTSEENDVKQLEATPNSTHLEELLTNHELGSYEKMNLSSSSQEFKGPSVEPDLVLKAKNIQNIDERIPGQLDDDSATQISNNSITSEDLIEKSQPKLITESSKDYDNDLKMQPGRTNTSVATSVLSDSDIDSQENNARLEIQKKTEHPEEDNEQLSTKKNVSMEEVCSTQPDNLKVVNETKEMSLIQPLNDEINKLPSNSEVFEKNISKPDETTLKEFINREIESTIESPKLNSIATSEKIDVQQLPSEVSINEKIEDNDSIILESAHIDNQSPEKQSFDKIEKVRNIDLVHSLNPVRSNESCFGQQAEKLVEQVSSEVLTNHEANIRTKDSGELIDFGIVNIDSDIEKVKDNHPTLSKDAVSPANIDQKEVSKLDEKQNIINNDDPQEIKAGSPLSNDEGEKNLSEINSAIQIQTMWRGFQARKKLLNLPKKISEISSTDENENIIDIQNKNLEESDNILKKKCDALQDLNTTIEEESKSNEDSVKSFSDSDTKAALKIQSSFRRFKSRKGRYSQRKLQLSNLDLNSDIGREYVNQALKIQSAWRAYKVRKNIREVEDKINQIENHCGNKLPKSIHLTDEDILKAVTKIQASLRGYMARKHFKNLLERNQSLDGIQEESTLEINPNEEIASDEHLLNTLKQLDDVNVPNTPPEISSKQSTERIMSDTPCAKENIGALHNIPKDCSTSPPTEFNNISSKNQSFSKTDVSIEGSAIHETDKLGDARNVLENKDIGNTTTVERLTDANIHPAKNLVKQEFESEQFKESCEVPDASKTVLPETVKEETDHKGEDQSDNQTGQQIPSYESPQGSLKKSKATNNLVKLAEEFEKNETDLEQVNENSNETEEISEEKVMIPVNDRSVGDESQNEKLASFEIPDFDLDLDDAVKISMSYDSTNGTIESQKDTEENVNNNQKSPTSLKNTNNNSNSKSTATEDDVSIGSSSASPHHSENEKENDSNMANTEFQKSPPNSSLQRLHLNSEAEKEKKVDNNSLETNIEVESSHTDNNSEEIEKNFSSISNAEVTECEMKMTELNSEKEDLDKLQKEEETDDHHQQHPFSIENQVTIIENISDKKNDELGMQEVKVEQKSSSEMNSEESKKSDDSIEAEKMGPVSIDDDSQSNISGFGHENQFDTSTKSVINSTQLKEDHVNVEHDFSESSVPLNRKEQEKHNEEISTDNQKRERLTLTDFMKKTLNCDESPPVDDINNKKKQGNEVATSEIDSSQKIDDKKLTTKSRYEAAVKIQSLYRGYRSRKISNSSVNNSKEPFTIVSESQIGQHVINDKKQFPNENSIHSEQVTPINADEVTKIALSPTEDHSLNGNSAAQTATSEKSSSVAVGIQTNTNTTRVLPDSNTDESQENVPGQVFVIIVSEFHPIISYMH